uniref:Fork-head domain-containing protein n=1 Tax=Strix occidentalis caurina TaxID=311401 RepID=A0A8D0EF93_STROC
MWVDPSVACPIPGSPETSSLNTSWDHPDPHCSEEDVLSPSSEAGKVQKRELLRQPQASYMLETHELKAMPKPWKSVVLRPQRVKLKHPRQMSIRIKGGWLRPPLNYCVLIALALRNSASGSLTAQQIYQFTRQHFPFFQVASKGWKNTIRHNLCFSSCFEKTAGLVCGEGKRKSCLWELTPEGRRKFQEEVEALPKEALDMVRQSMSKPNLMRSLFGLRFPLAPCC